MNANRIIEQTQLDGFSVFPIPGAARQVLQELDFKSLATGFYDSKSMALKLLSTDEFAGLRAGLKLEAKQRGIAWNEHGVIRVVEQHCAEKYRTHFDSHQYTLVVPLSIPSEEGVKYRGQLYMVPKARREPLNDFRNLITKSYSFLYRGKKGFCRLEKKRGFRFVDLKEGEALLFKGITALHGNVQNDSMNKRITMLWHMADPFPSGAGSLVRSFRSKLRMRKNL